MNRAGTTTRISQSSPRQRTFHLTKFLCAALIFFYLHGLITQSVVEDALKKQEEVMAVRKGYKKKKFSPQVLKSDLIYKRARTVFVIPEYRLIFFTFPKVACSEWKRMFMRMNNNPKWCIIKGIDAHEPKVNKISTLSDYPPEIATAMMTSSSWTKATILREPKERVLSAFLDKAVKEKYYVRKCCEKIPNKRDAGECKNNAKNFKSFLYFVMKYPEECYDVHWEPQLAKVDKKWWPWMDFIGYQSNLLHDSQVILKSLKSRTDPVKGRSAWDRYGINGWGNDNELCENRTHSFLEENSSRHNIDSGSKMMEWYTPETEKMVEEGWAIEWSRKEVQFPNVTLFP